MRLTCTITAAEAALTLGYQETFGEKPSASMLALIRFRAPLVSEGQSFKWRQAKRSERRFIQLTWRPGTPGANQPPEDPGADSAAKGSAPPPP